MRRMRDCRNRTNACIDRRMHPFDYRFYDTNCGASKKLGLCTYIYMIAVSGSPQLGRHSPPLGGDFCNRDIRTRRFAARILLVTADAGDARPTAAACVPRTRTRPTNDMGQ